jgi:phage FluMu protein Com
MSEHLLKFLLSELATIRIRCAACSSVIEVDYKGLGAYFTENKCPACKTAFAPRHRLNTVTTVADFLKTLHAVMDMGRFFQEQITVEFVLPGQPLVKDA